MRALFVDCLMRGIVAGALTSQAASVLADSQKKANSPTDTPIACEIVGKPARLPDLAEASGVAAGRQRPDLLWIHNDSGGEPLVLGVDLAGTVRQLVRLTGAVAEDWEDIAVGPCPQGSCLYVADIGDNDAKRKHVTLYRVPEPLADVSDARVEPFRATYPDGPRNSEAMFIDSTGGIFVVTKGDTGTIQLYQFPSLLKLNVSLQLKPVGAPQRAIAQGKITGAAASPDGKWVALRSYSFISFYRAEELTRGIWREAARADLASLKEPQGEGVTFGPNNIVYIVSEGGDHSRPGVLNRLSCVLPP